MNNRFELVLFNLQIIDTFLDSVMSICLTKTEIIAGSVDGTVRTFDIRVGRYVLPICSFSFLFLLRDVILQKELSVNVMYMFSVERYLIIWVSLSTVSLFQMMATVY